MSFWMELEIKSERLYWFNRCFHDVGFEAGLVAPQQLHNDGWNGYVSVFSHPAEEALIGCYRADYADHDL